MAHVHDEEGSSYHLEQLCTIGVCGALAGVCIMLWWVFNYGTPPPPPRQPMIRVMLADKFHLPVLLGGLALLVLVVIRALAVWRATGQAKAPVHSHNHDHVHEHDLGHEHGHAHAITADHAITAEPRPAGSGCDEHAHEHAAGHSHGNGDDHGHDHGWSPWRYIMLLLPVVLYFLGLPDKLPSEEAVNPGELGADTTKSHRPYFGMGIVKNTARDLLQVKKLVKGSQAIEKGIEAGDFIQEIKIEVDGEGKPLPKPESYSTKGMSLDEVEKILQGEHVDVVKLVLERGGDQAVEVELSRKTVMTLDFKELDKASFYPQQRDWYQGQVGRLKGQFAPAPHDDKVFTLVRWRMTCCAADAVAIKAHIVAPKSVTHVKAQDWVEVQGQIQFRQMRDRNEFVPVLVVTSNDMIRKTDPDLDPYLR